MTHQQKILHQKDVTRLQHTTNMTRLPVGPTEKQTLGMYFKHVFRQGKNIQQQNGLKKTPTKQNQVKTWPKIYET